MQALCLVDPGAKAAAAPRALSSLPPCRCRTARMALVPRTLEARGLDELLGA